MSLKKQKSQGKTVEVTVNSKEENFGLNFVQEFGFSTVYRFIFACKHLTILVEGGGGGSGENTRKGAMNEIFF